MDPNNNMVVVSFIMLLYQPKMYYSEKSNRFEIKITKLSSMFAKDKNLIKINHCIISGHVRIG